MSDSIITIPVIRKYSAHRDQLDQIARERLARRYEISNRPPRCRPLLVIDNERPMQHGYAAREVPFQ